MPVQISTNSTLVSRLLFFARSRTLPSLLTLVVFIALVLSCDIDETPLPTIRTAPTFEAGPGIAEAPTIQRAAAIEAAPTIARADAVETAPTIERAETIERAPTVRTASTFEAGPSIAEAPTIQQAEAIETAPTIARADAVETAPTIERAATVEKASTIAIAPTVKSAPTARIAPTAKLAEVFASTPTAPAHVPTQAPRPPREFDIVTLLAPDAIPAINNPTFFHTIEEADTAYRDTEFVLGIEIDGDARAYSVPLLSRHEIVNDVVAGNPVAVTW